MEQMEFMTALLLVLVGLALYINIAYLWIYDSTAAGAGGTGPVYLHSLPMEQMEFMTALQLVLVGLALYIYIAYLWNRWS
jgi:hypothetical protein